MRASWTGRRRAGVGLVVLGVMALTVASPAAEAKTATKVDRGIKIGSIYDGTPTESSTISGRVVAASKRGRRACAPAPVELYANFALLATTSTDEHGRFVLEFQGAFNPGDSYRVVAPA